MHRQSRNSVGCDYRDANEVNYRLVWATVQNDLEVLEERIPQIIDSLNMPSDFKFDQSADENNNVD